jgi:hypothetical protein
MLRGLHKTSPTYAARWCNRGSAEQPHTFGILMGLGQITEGLAAISIPSYFLFDAPLANNGTSLADTSSTGLTRPNQGRTTTSWS